LDDDVNLHGDERVAGRYRASIAVHSTSELELEAELNIAAGRGHAAVNARAQTYSAFIPCALNAHCD